MVHDGQAAHGRSGKGGLAELHVLRVRRTVNHLGGVNRVRSMPQQPGVIAIWGDNAQVGAMPSPSLSAQPAALSSCALHHMGCICRGGKGKWCVPRSASNQF